MTDYRLIAAELDQITARYNQLDEHLYPLLREFDTWMRLKFPRPPATSFYDQHWPWQVYTLPGNDYVGIDTDQPTTAEGIRFTGHDRDQDTFTVILPFLWLEDREAFRDHVIEKGAELQAAAEREKIARAEAAQQARIDAARKLLAEVDGA
jgi:hypothetical protein